MSETPSSETPSVVLEANQVSRRFGGRWAVAGVNLRLSAGRSLLIVGHNGAGKTTLLRLLATTLRPTTGSVTISGIDPVEDPLRARRGISLLAQRNGLYLDLDALANLRVAERLMGLPHDGQRAPSLLERVGLDGRGHELVRGFSAGMRKRLAFARMLLQDAAVVMLDEPYGQLDPSGFELVDRLIDDLTAQNRAVVVVTHLVERAARLLRSGLVLEHGRMAWVGRAAELPSGFRDR